MTDTTATILLTAELVSAYVANNKLAAHELPNLIKTVHQALDSGGAPEPAEAAAERPTPAQIKKSITPTALISFEDGKPYKTLKRHLATQGLTIAEYKAKWGLPADYPTTAASYSQARSALAKAVGLGQGGRKPAKAGKTPSST